MSCGQDSWTPRYILLPLGRLSSFSYPYAVRPSLHPVTGSFRTSNFKDRSFNISDRVCF